MSMIADRVISCERSPTFELASLERYLNRLIMSELREADRRGKAELNLKHRRYLALTSRRESRLLVQFLAQGWSEVHGF
jgi:hypothetical protein